MNSTSKPPVRVPTSEAQLREQRRAEVRAKIEAGRLSFLGLPPAWASQPGARDAALPSEPAMDVRPKQEPAQKPALEPARETRGFAEPAPQPVNPFTERTTLIPGPPKTSPKEVYPRPHGERSTPPLQVGITPKEGEAERQPTMVPAEPEPKPQGFVEEGKSPDDLVSALVNAARGADREAQKLSEAQGLSRAALEQGTAPMERPQFSEVSMVETRIDNLKRRIPPRFVSHIDEAMEVLGKNMKGYEGLIKVMMVERRWTREQEESLAGALSTASDELQRIFSRMYKEEAVRRVESRQELKGLADPGEVEKEFAYTILKSKHPNANRELNVFDAFAKGTMFVFLSQQRPRTFMQALGHSEISKPYGTFGGVEGLGVYIGLDLPDPSTVHSISNPLIGLGFRLYMEVHLRSLSDWLVAVASGWPKPQTVGRFEHMVKHDVDEFQRAVSDTRFNAEMFFQLLGKEDHSKLREDKGLNAIFEEAAKGPGRLVYGNADDIFDSVEAIVGYMNMLKHDKNARNFFLESYIANYPLDTNGGTFYKMFGMCLFNEKDDIGRHPEVVKAFQKDPDARIQFQIQQKLDQLQERQTLMGMNADATNKGSGTDEGDPFAGLGD